MNYLNDAFISYSSANAAFASELESRLEHYTAPKALNLDQRKLRAFRYEGDMTGTDYYTAINKQLDQSRCMILLCSPDARKSPYVEDEIRRFVEQSGGNRPIIPVLLDGLVNNEASSEDQKAFPESLYLTATMPLAIDYRGYAEQPTKLNKPPFEAQWYTLLAILFDVTRDAIEQRDKARRLRQLRTTTAIACSVAVALAGLSIVAWVQRGTAISARLESESRLVTLAADAAFNQGQSVKSLILASKALTIAQRDKAGTRSPRAETLIQQIIPTLPGIGLAGWQAMVPRQTSVTPWAADEPSGRWLITGNFGSTESRLWDLLDPNPGQTGLLLPLVSREALRSGKIEFERDVDLANGRLSQYDWKLFDRTFQARGEQLPQDSPDEVISASSDWRLVQREDENLWLTHLHNGQPSIYPSLPVSAPNVEITGDSDMLFMTRNENWLMVLGLRGHRLVNLPLLANIPSNVEPITASAWLPESGLLLIATGGRLAIHDGSEWLQPKVELGVDFVRNLVASSDGKWLLVQGGSGNWTIWQRLDAGYVQIHDVGSARELPLSALSDQLRAVVRRPTSRLSRLPGYEALQVHYDPAITISSQGRLSIKNQQSAFHWQLQEFAAPAFDEALPSSQLAPSTDLETGSPYWAASTDGNWFLSSRGLYRHSQTNQDIATDDNLVLVSEWPEAGAGSYPSVGLFSADSRWLLLQYSFRGPEACSSGDTARLIDLRDEDPLSTALVLEPDRFAAYATLSEWIECPSSEFTNGGDWLAFGNLLVPLEDSSAGVIRLAGSIVWIAPDGSRVLVENVVDGSRYWRFQPLDPLDMIAQACEKAGRNLSIEEWASLFPSQTYEAICTDYPLPPELFSK